MSVPSRFIDASDNENEHRTTACSNIIHSESTTESVIDDSDSYSIDGNNVNISSNENNNVSGNFDESCVLSILHGNHVHGKIPSKKDRNTSSADEMKLKNPKTCNEFVTAVNKCYNHVSKELTSERSVNQIFLCLGGNGEEQRH